jgi:hypothetical protein
MWLVARVPFAMTTRVDVTSPRPRLSCATTYADRTRPMILSGTSHSGPSTQMVDGSRLHRRRTNTEKENRRQPSPTATAGPDAGIPPHPPLRRHDDGATSTTTSDPGRPAPHHHRQQRPRALEERRAISAGRWPGPKDRRPNWTGTSDR